MNTAIRIATALTLAFGAPFSAPEGISVETSSDALPRRLSETGLYVRGSTTKVRPALLEFSPQYPLWSDGATKRRWIYLPPNTSIDASRPDAWEFPPGTKLWKEFSLGRRVETRLIERLADGTWRFATYVWNENETDAVLAPPDGIASLTVSGAPRGRYTIPSEYDCRACHEGAKVPVLGFSALQLSPDRDPLAPHAERKVADGADLRRLVERGWLRNLPETHLASPPRIAGTSPVERAALGYLHGNCGHCHGKSDDSDASVPVDVILDQSIGGPESRETVLRSLAGASSRFRLPYHPEVTQIVSPGRAHLSVLPLRMRSRDPRMQMPPLGTVAPDTEALVLIERWIDQDLQPE